MQVTLTVVGGVHDGKQIPITVPEFRIGRDAKCHLRPASEDVSRNHCAIIMRSDQRLFLRDYGSRNGTILNQRLLVHGEVQLEDGDMIEVGPLLFRLNLHPTAVGDTVPTIDLSGTPNIPKAESALEVSDDIHNDIFDALLSDNEPGTDETILVSRPRLVTPSEKPPKDAGPKLVDE